MTGLIHLYHLMHGYRPRCTTHGTYAEQFLRNSSGGQPPLFCCELCHWHRHCTAVYQYIRQSVLSSALRCANHLVCLAGLATSVLLLSTIDLFADTVATVPERGFACDDQRTRGWNFYCDPDAVKEEEPEAAIDKPPAPPPAPPKSYTEQIEDYRAALDELKHRAILEPTTENVVAYMEAQAAMVRQAGLFTEVWQRSLFANPSLDANVDRPLSQIGGNLYQDRLDVDREAAFLTATSERALMFVYDGSPECLVCATQGEVIRSLVDQYGIAVLAVTRDGIAIPTFPQSRIDAGEVSNLGFADVPSPFLALVEPRSGQVDLIGAGLMTQDIVLDRIRIITSIPQGELYD